MVAQMGGNILGSAKALGVNQKTIRDHLKRAAAKQQQDPAVEKGMAALGMEAPPDGGWIMKKTPDEDGMCYSFRFSKPDAKTDFLAQIREAIAEAVDGAEITLPPRFIPQPGQLLVLDLSDVHIGKLCVTTETGYGYSIEVAAHRMVEGARLLMTQGKALGVTRVLLVVGNDILHTDNNKHTTTSGTLQDTAGSYFQSYQAAIHGYRGIVTLALEMGLAVDVVYCPSNHDWHTGYTIAHNLAAWFRAHPAFSATDYNISENHRKYYRFGGNLMIFTHGDGAKEADLPQIMLVEAKHHAAECQHRYAYLHHFHHKIKKALGVRPQSREKDHIAMTVMSSGIGQMEGDNLQIEYVRSPSPPDGWHSRNGYLNRQAVEAFIHDAHDGQKIRLTEWF